MDGSLVGDANVLSVDGTMRVVSDEFSINLLNPEQEAYRSKANKYNRLVSSWSVSTNQLPLHDPFYFVLDIINIREVEIGQVFL